MSGTFAITVHFVYENYVMIIASGVIVSSLLYFFRDMFMLEKSEDE